MITPEMIQVKTEQLKQDEDSLTSEELFKRYIEICELSIVFYTEQCQQAQDAEATLAGLILRTTNVSFKHLPSGMVDDLLTSMIIDKATISSTIKSCYQKIAENKQLIARLKMQLD